MSDRILLGRVLPHTRRHNESDQDMADEKLEARVETLHVLDVGSLDKLIEQSGVTGFRSLDNAFEVKNGEYRWYVYEYLDTKDPLERYLHRLYNDGTLDQKLDTLICFDW